MKINIKRKIKASNTSIETFFFLDDINDSLRNYSMCQDLESCPVLKSTTFKYHSEIYNITINEDGKEKSMFKLFDDYYLIVLAEGNRLSIIPTPINKRDLGLNYIEGYLKEFKDFLEEKVRLVQGSYKEVILLD